MLPCEIMEILTWLIIGLVAGLLASLLEKAADDKALVEQLYLHTVSRKPSTPELKIGLEALQKDRRRGAENLQWALLNSPEFLFNY